MAQVRTPSHNHVQTPRIGGCTGAFFNLFDWNSSKRFASTKRLPAERPEKALGRSKSFRDDRSAGARSDMHRGGSPATKTPSHGTDRGVISEDEASTKTPGLVARLMGLDSLPDNSVHSKHSKHRRSRSFSGNESASYSERDSRPEKLALRDLLKQDHESFEKSLRDEILVIPVEYKEQQGEKGRKGALETPVKSIVPYVDSPTGSCRSVYALPYVHKGEKSPFLARLHPSPAHPSPVLQPSKCHNQMPSPAKTSPATKSKRASRFLEAAVKILEEISDNEQCFPREREGMRSIAEFAASSPPSNATDLLHCRSMSKIWNGSEDTDSIGSRSNRSLISRGSFRESQRRDRVCRDIFENSFSESARSISPPPRRGTPSKGARSPWGGANAKEVKASGILRTQEASVGGFKTDVKKSSTGRRKSRNDSVRSCTDSVHFSHQTAASVRERKSLHSKLRIISNGLEDNDSFTSDDESLTDQLSSTAPAVTREFKTLEVDRSSFRRNSRGEANSPSVCSAIENSKEQSIRSEDGSLVEKMHGWGTSTSLTPQHDKLRPVGLSRSRGGQQEIAVPAPSKRVPHSRTAKAASASIPSHSRKFSGQMDDLKLSVRTKKAYKQEKQARGAAESTSASVLQCQSELPFALKRTRRKSRHGSQKVEENSASPSFSEGGERRTSPSNLYIGDRRNNNLEAVQSSIRGEQTSGNMHVINKNYEREDWAKSPSQQVTVRNVEDIFPEHPLALNTALPNSRNAGGRDFEPLEPSLGEDEIHLDSTIFDMNLGTGAENQLTGALVHGLQNLEQTQCPVRDLFPVPDVAQSDLEELLILGMDDLHWNDGMVEQQREKSSRARYCDIRASVESLQSICGTLDEDVCNVDDGSSPSPHKFTGECLGADAYDESSTPVLMKRFLDKPLRLGRDMGETSPVSILDSPFGDFTTSESSLAESEQRVANAQEEEGTKDLSEIVAELELEIEMEDSSPATVSTSQESTACDKVRQAILDISTFKILDHERASAFKMEAKIGQFEEKTFVREVLSAAQLLSSPGRSPNWYERDLAVDPCLFDKMEGGDIDRNDSCTENGGFLCESGGMWRCDRKLLFDCVNEAFSQNARHYKDPEPWLRRPVLRKRSLRHKLVEEVQDKINGWRELASHAIDTLIDIDMSTRAGKWTDFSEGVADVGAEIECMLWKVMVDEVVLDLAATFH